MFPSCCLFSQLNLLCLELHNQPEISVYREKKAYSVTLNGFNAQLDYSEIIDKNCFLIVSNLGFWLRFHRTLNNKSLLDQHITGSQLSKYHIYTVLAFVSCSKRSKRQLKQTEISKKIRDMYFSLPYLEVVLVYHELMFGQPYLCVLMAKRNTGQAIIQVDVYLIME